MEFNFKEDHILEDEAVLLRPLKKEDLEHLQPFSLNEPTLWKYSMMQPTGPGGMEEYIRVALEMKAAGREYPFIVYDKIRQEYAGSTRFYEIKLFNRTLHLGYTWYGSAFQGTGLNKHCKFLLLRFAFEHMGMERVEFGANNNNERSKAAMKSIGCTVEGILRNSGCTPDGQRYDGIVLSILRSEWESHVKNNLIQKLK